MKILLDPAELEAERGAVHRNLLQRKIYTKSMLLRWRTCPVEFERVFVQGIPSRLSWAAVEGLVLHALLEEAARRAIKSAGFQDGEALQILRDEYDKKAHLTEGLPPDYGEDVALGKLLILFKLANPQLATLGPIIEAVEKFYGGDDAPVSMGGKRVAGHADLVLPMIVRDWKVVGSTSKYRQKNRSDFSLELAMYAKLAGKPMAGYHCLVTNLKSGPVVDPPNDITVSPEKMEAAEVQVEGIADQIEKGNFPPTATIGEFPCHPKWCSHFGKCRVTKSISVSSLTADE